MKTEPLTALQQLRARIEAMDCYTAHGARDAGLHFADISTEHVKAFRDRILDMIDESGVDSQPPVPSSNQHCISRTGCGWPQLCQSNGYCMRPTRQAPSNGAVTGAPYTFTQYFEHVAICDWRGYAVAEIRFGTDGMPDAQTAVGCAKKWIERLNSSSPETNGKRGRHVPGCVCDPKDWSEGQFFICEAYRPQSETNRACAVCLHEKDCHSARSLADDSTPVGRQQPSKLLDAGSSPAGRATYEELCAFIQRWVDLPLGPKPLQMQVEAVQLLRRSALKSDARRQEGVVAQSDEIERQLTGEKP